MCLPGIKAPKRLICSFCRAPVCFSHAFDGAAASCRLQDCSGHCRMHWKNAWKITVCEHGSTFVSLSCQGGVTRALLEDRGCPKLLELGMLQTLFISVPPNHSCCQGALRAGCTPGEGSRALQDNTAVRSHLRVWEPSVLLSFPIFTFRLVLSPVSWHNMLWG